MVENETDLNIKTLAFDNEGEHLDADFKKYYDENDIKMKKIVPENSQQNGVVEMINRTLNERVRSMRLHTRLPKIIGLRRLILQHT